MSRPDAEIVIPEKISIEFFVHSLLSYSIVNEEHLETRDNPTSQALTSLGDIRVT